MTEDLVVLDTSVLYPIMLCDLLLRCADRRLFKSVWSLTILLELERTVADRVGVPWARAGIATMARHVPDATIEGFDALIPGMTNHAKDRLVAALAILAGASRIVTTNLRHFPIPALSPYDITPLSPDEFLLSLHGQSAATVRTTVVGQANRYRRPPMSVLDLLDRLSVHAPVFVHRLRQSETP